MAKRRVGSFEIEDKLGSGGMGIVYLATYVKSGQKVALKVLTPAMSSDEQVIKRFEREMEILKKLRHENIVRYYGGGRNGTQHYYAMELMAGGTLEQVINQRGRLTWEQTVDFAMQIAKALEHSHFHAIIHRDLKPANCFLSKDGTLKLGDFGIARDTQATALTAAGKTVGTYSYMAPEQISGKPPISRKTDLYALGCVMFEMLTGKPPFEAATPAEMLYSHLKEEPPRVTSAALDCPLYLETVIDKLLEKDPEERYFDALALQVALAETPRKVTEQRGVSKATLAGAAGTTKSTGKQDRTTLEAIVGKKKKKKKKGPFYEQVWFLVGCLALLVSTVTWLMWPASNAELFAKAEQLMREDDPTRWDVAKREYLEPLLARNPEPQYADPAREWLDQIEIRSSQRQTMKRYDQGKPPESTVEGQFFESKRFEDFGDRVTALQRYRGLVEINKASTELADRAVIDLARQRIVLIVSAGSASDDRIATVNRNLKLADEHFFAGRRLEADKIWNSVISLYGSNEEFASQVKYSKARLAGEKVEPLNFDERSPADASSSGAEASASEPDASSANAEEAKPNRSASESEPAAKEPE